MLMLVVDKQSLRCQWYRSLECGLILIATVSVQTCALKQSRQRGAVADVSNTFTEFVDDGRHVLAIKSLNPSHVLACLH
jgi:hypothetical protein